MKPVLLALLALAISCHPSSQPEQSVKDPTVSGHRIRILALGDSYTVGEGVATTQRWPEVLASRLSADVAVVARTGWTVAELSRAMDDSTALDSSYDLVTLSIGVNDEFRGGTPADYEVAFSGLLARAVGLADEAPHRVVVVSIPDYGVTPFGARRDPVAIGSRLDEFNARAQKVVVERGARWVDITPISRARPSEVCADGLHPSATQYARWADAIEPAARSAAGGIEPAARAAADTGPGAGP